MIVAADRVEPLVGLGVDAGDEEARNRGHLLRVAARLDQPLEPADVRLGDLGVAVEAEDQRHVDPLATAIISSIAGTPAAVAGILT